MKPWRSHLGTVMAVTVLGLTGCASGPDGGPPSAPSPSQPVRTGALSAPANSLDPVTTTSPGSMLLAFNIHDSLAIMIKKGVALSLVESIRPNATADEWTVTPCDGLIYSDGTTATGQDALDSLSHFAQSPSYATLYFGIDFEVSSTSGSTATLKLRKPASDFLESSLGMFSAVVSEGKFTSIGAGPLVVDRGDPGTGYRLHANDKHWDGTPSVPWATMVPIPDSAAQANILHTGEVDPTTSLNSTTPATLFGVPNAKVANATLESVPALELALNTCVAPFDGPGVQRAMKLTMNRDKLVSTVLGSTGEVANDMPSKGCDNYPEDVVQTVVSKEEVKHIFAEKGAMSFMIVAANVMPDMASSAELMAQEFTETGVQVAADKHNPQTCHSNLEGLHQAQTATTFQISRNPVTESCSQVIPDYPFNLSGLTSETIQQNLAKVTATLDAAEQKKLVGEISEGIHNQDGDLIWGYQKQVPAYRAGLENLTSIQSVPWLTKTTFNPVG